MLPPSRMSARPAAVATQTDQPKMPCSLDPFGVLFRDLKPEDELMVRQFIDPANFTRLMVMPRIGEAMHREAVQVFLRHYDDLQDGCFSMYGAFASAMGISLPSYDAKINFQRARKALKRFTIMPCPEDMDGFARWLWLALTVLIYAHCELGSPAAPVRRTILTHLVAMGEKGREMRKHPLIVSFTTLDILECLFYRQRPVTDLDEDCVVGLESFPGLVSPLIRFLYRLCMTNAAEGSEGYDWVALNELEEEVEVWQPDIDPHELNRSDAVETNHLLTRTRIHKTAIILYVHRIRYPFGEEDVTAKALAMSILSDLDLATATTKQAPEWVTMPFLLAAIEVCEPSKRAKVELDLWKYVDGISPRARAMAMEFLKAVWVARDAMVGVDQGWRWMDCMGSLPPLCVYI